MFHFASLQGKEDKNNCKVSFPPIRLVKLRGDTCGAGKRCGEMAPPPCRGENAARAYRAPVHHVLMLGSPVRVTRRACPERFDH